MKVVSIFLGLINSLLAGLLITFLVTSVDLQISLAWWVGMRIALVLAIIVVGILSWIEMITPIRPGPMLMSSLFLVAIGPATMVWTFHRASLTGHLEYYMLMYGASLLVQGISLLLGFSEGRNSVAVS